MAIVIEKQKKGFNWFAVFIIIILAVIVGVAAYFLFFSSLPLVEKVIPYQLQVSTQLSQAQTQSLVQAVVNSKLYKSLQSYAILPIPSPDSIGKTNPFVR